MPHSRPSTLSAIIFPRIPTRRTASAADMLPAQLSAEYSPRLSPAAICGLIPTDASKAAADTAKATIHG